MARTLPETELNLIAPKIRLLLRKAKAYQLSLAERFGAVSPWLDPYAATSHDEFFAVASEAYFVNRARFAADFPRLLPMFDAFFNPAG